MIKMVWSMLTGLVNKTVKLIKNGHDLNYAFDEINKNEQEMLKDIYKWETDHDVKERIVRKDVSDESYKLAPRGQNEIIDGVNNLLKYSL